LLRDKGNQLGWGKLVFFFLSFFCSFIKEWVGLLGFFFFGGAGGSSQMPYWVCQWGWGLHDPLASATVTRPEETTSTSKSYNFKAKLTPLLISDLCVTAATPLCATIAATVPLMISDLHVTDC